MPNSSKAKGNNFERELSTHLTKVFGLNHMRVPTSGAWTGGKNAHRIASLSSAQQLLTVGDIIVPTELSTYSYECKFYSKFPFNLLFEEDGCPLLDKWIEQAKCVGRNWFLIYKVNHFGCFVVYDRNQIVLNYNTGISFMCYKDYIITKMEGFFERNKDLMLHNNYYVNTSTLTLSCSA